MFAKEETDRQIIIGDFSCMLNKVSEFLYRPSEDIMGFAIKKGKFKKLLDDPVGKNLKPIIRSRYI